MPRIAEGRPAPDELVALTGSRSRAAIIALLFGDRAMPLTQSQIASLTRLARSTVQSELDHLVEAGLVVRGKAGGVTYKLTRRAEHYGRPYSANTAALLYPDLRIVAAKTRGAAAAIRGALPPGVHLSWITGRYALLRARPDEPVTVVVIAQQKRMTSKKLEVLGPTLGRAVRPTVIYPDEWVARLDKRELTVLKLRRGPKLWLRGDAVGLYLMERHERESRQLLQKVIATGLDLTDEWDDDWDPTAPTMADV